MPLPFEVVQPPASPIPGRASTGLTRRDRDPRTAPFVLALMAAALFDPPQFAHIALSKRLLRMRPN